MCACQAILQLDLVLILVIFFGTRQIALGQGDPLHEHGFFVHRLAICDELLISMLGMLKEKIRCLNARQNYVA